MVRLTEGPSGKWRTGRWASVDCQRGIDGEGSRQFAQLTSRRRRINDCKGVGRRAVDRVQRSSADDSLRAFVSLDDCAISQRTVMNNAG